MVHCIVWCERSPTDPLTTNSSESHWLKYKAIKIKKTYAKAGFQFSRSICDCFKGNLLTVESVSNGRRHNPSGHKTLNLPDMEGHTIAVARKRSQTHLKY